VGIGVEKVLLVAVSWIDTNGVEGVPGTLGEEDCNDIPEEDFIPPVLLAPAKLSSTNNNNNNTI